jgi:hypothetical protein
LPSQNLLSLAQTLFIYKNKAMYSKVKLSQLIPKSKLTEKREGETEREAKSLSTI